MAEVVADYLEVESEEEEEVVERENIENTKTEEENNVCIPSIETEEEHKDSRNSKQLTVTEEELAKGEEKIGQQHPPVIGEVAVEESVTPNSLCEEVVEEEVPIIEASIETNS